MQPIILICLNSIHACVCVLSGRKREGKEKERVFVEKMCVKLTICVLYVRVRVRVLKKKCKSERDKKTETINIKKEVM